MHSAVAVCIGLHVMYALVGMVHCITCINTFPHNYINSYMYDEPEWTDKLEPLEVNTNVIHVEKKSASHLLVYEPLLLLYISYRSM